MIIVITVNIIAIITTIAMFVIFLHAMNIIIQYLIPLNAIYQQNI